MIDFVNYKAPSAQEWAALQAKAGFTNPEASKRLGVGISTIKRIRNGSIDAQKAVYFMLCIYANVEIVLFDEPEQQQ